MDWKESLVDREKIILATSSKENEPRAIIVISLGFIDDQLLIGACLMEKSLENIKNNNRVSIVTLKEGGYYRINGKAKIFLGGDYLKIAIEKSSPPLPKAAVVINIEEVVNLDTGERII